MHITILAISNSVEKFVCYSNPCPTLSWEVLTEHISHFNKWKIQRGTSMETWFIYHQFYLNLYTSRHIRCSVLLPFQFLTKHNSRRKIVHLPKNQTKSLQKLHSILHCSQPSDMHPLTNDLHPPLKFVTSFKYV